MSMDMIKKIVFFDALNDEAKEKAREWFRDSNDMPFLTENIGEFITEELTEAGYTINVPVEVFYSLSYSQGDGVSFTVTLERNGGRYFVTRNGHYMHDMTMDVSCESLEDFASVECKSQLEEMRAIARKAEKFGYRQIELENSDEVVDENILANEYTFTLEGQRMEPDKII